jgi:DNA-binding response OmpR family regulator
MRGELTAEQNEILDLRDQVYDLQQKLANCLEEARLDVGRPPRQFPRSWRLTPAEAAMLGLFAASVDGFASRKDLHFVSARKNKYTGVKIVDVMVCKLRRKLRDTGISITAVWGAGYEISPESLAFLKAALVPDIESSGGACATAGGEMRTA